MTRSDCPQPSTDYKKPSFNEIDKLARLLLPVGYAWPASGLNGYDMAKLNELKKRTGKPVTELLRDAVQLLCESMFSESSPPVTNAKPKEKKIQPVEPPPVLVEAMIAGEKRSIQRSLFSDSPAETVTCAESGSSGE